MTRLANTTTTTMYTTVNHKRKSANSFAPIEPSKSKSALQRMSDKSTSPSSSESPIRIKPTNIAKNNAIVQMKTASVQKFIYLSIDNVDGVFVFLCSA